MHSIILFPKVNMSDRFGDVMLSNLHSRGCSLAGVDACVSLKSQENRYNWIISWFRKGTDCFDIADPDFFKTAGAVPEH